MQGVRGGCARGFRLVAPLAGGISVQMPLEAVIRARRGFGGGLGPVSREKGCEALTGPQGPFLWLGLRSLREYRRKGYRGRHLRPCRRLIGCAEVEATAWAVEKRKNLLVP